MSTQAKANFNDDHDHETGVLPPPATNNAETEPLIGANEDDDVPAVSTAPMLKPEHRQGDRTAKTAALLAVAAFAVSTWVLVFTHNPSQLGWFTFHPICQSLAIALFTYGILTLQPTSQPKTKADGLARHERAMAFLGFPIIAFGSFAMIFNKYVHDAPHFTTWHATFGLITIIWLVIHAGLGAASVWAPALFGGVARAKAVWKYHRLSGYLLLPFMFLTAHLAGAWSTWVVMNTSYADRLITYTILPVVVLVGVFVRVRPSKMKFF